MRILIILIGFGLLTAGVAGQTNRKNEKLQSKKGILATSVGKKEEDRKAIKAMTGTYFVDFRYAETFSENSDYELKKPYRNSGLEYITVDEESENKISLLHLLIMEDSEGKISVIKHWREDWLYEHSHLYVFDHNLTWRYKKLSTDSIKGKWTQKVFSVDDSPRYEGIGTWVHVDGKHYWESVSDAPLPRREHTKRSDYNVLHRRNRHILTDYGFLHEQDNLKIIRTTGAEDTVVVAEKGLNMYKKVEDQTAGNPGKEWWEKHRPFWREVLAAWYEIYLRGKDISFREVKGDEKLFSALFKLDEAHEKNPMPSDKLKNEIRVVISNHLATANAGLKIGKN